MIGFKLVFIPFSFRFERFVYFFCYFFLVCVCVFFVSIKVKIVSSRFSVTINSTIPITSTHARRHTHPCNMWKQHVDVSVKVFFFFYLGGIIIIIIYKIDEKKKTPHFPHTYNATCVLAYIYVFMCILCVCVCACGVVERRGAARINQEHQEQSDCKF